MYTNTHIKQEILMLYITYNKSITVDFVGLAGKLVEYDVPSKLLDANSYFSKLVAEYWSSCKRNSQ